jgi:6-O-methylguanine DNA methyltransferase, DNA binding domain
LPLSAYTSSSTSEDLTPPPSVPGTEAVCEDAVQQLGEYFAGGRTTFDLDVRPEGDDFQKRVWELLRPIPNGETRSYGQSAREPGRPVARAGSGCRERTQPVVRIGPVSPRRRRRRQPCWLCRGTGPQAGPARPRGTAAHEVEETLLRSHLTPGPVGAVPQRKRLRRPAHPAAARRAPRRRDLLSFPGRGPCGDRRDWWAETGDQHLVRRTRQS